jgi:hypothetical protein
MEFLAGVSAKGGSSAAQALGAGALAMHGKDKARKEQLASVKEMYDKADLLEQEALVRDRMKDVEGAMALRKQAADLQRQIAAQKSTERLQASQAGLADAQAAFTRDVKPGVEQAKANRVSRPAGGAAGVKQWTPAQEGTWIKGTTKDILAQSGKDLSTATPMEYAAAQQRAIAQLAALKRQQAQPGGLAAAAAASPAGPSVKFLGFE